MDEDRTRLLGTPFVARAARWGLVSWAVIGVLVLAYLLYQYLLHPIRIIFPPLAVALIVVFLLNPIVTAAQERGVPRVLGSLVTYLIFLTFVGFGLRLLIPIIADQVQDFARTVPNLFARAQDSLTVFADRLGFDITPAALNAETQERILNVAGSLLSITRGLLHVAVILILGPILAFYLLVDLPKIRRGMQSMIPARRRSEVESIGRDLSRAIGGFFRGQLLVALFVGVASTIALYIVGLPYWALVGMIAGLFNLIPLIGPFIGGIIAVFIAFTTATTGEGLLALAPGWPLAAGSAIALTIVQQVDNHIISPNVVARTVRLHPVTVMLALLAGGTLLGLWGMLLAVPAVASAKVLILHAWDTRMTWPPAPPEEREPPPVAQEPAPDGEPAAPEARASRSRPWWRRVRVGRGARPAPAAGPKRPPDVS